MIFNLMKPVPVQDEPTLYLYGREADKTVTYNGVELPPLPEWDKTAYPYAVICEYRGFMLFGYHLVVSTAPLYSTDTKVWQLSGNYGCLSMKSTCYTDNEYDYSYTWVADSTILTEVWQSPYNSIEKGALYFGKPIWSNYDVELCDGNLKPMGETALSATDPVTTYTNADVTINGVGYVGAVLPKLPEWDKTAYPYAQIRGRKLYLSSSPITYNTSTWKYTYSTPCLLANFTYSADAICWGELTENETQPTGYDSTYWSNHNILDENGNADIEASVPVPISLPFTLFDGEVSTRKPDYSDYSYSNIHILYAYKIGDTLRVTFNGEVKEYTYTRQEDSFVESEGFGLWLPQYMGTYWYLDITTKTAGTHSLKIELIETTPNETWETLFDVEVVTIEEQLSEGQVNECGGLYPSGFTYGHCFVTAANEKYGYSGYQPKTGDKSRITLNGVVSETLSVVTYYDSSPYWNGYVGNLYLTLNNFRESLRLPDDGTDFCVTMGTMAIGLYYGFWLNTRTAGTYNLKIERMVTHDTKGCNRQPRKSRRRT